MPILPDLPGVLSTSQVARRLELCDSRIRQLLASGQLKSEPTPFGRLIRVEDLEAFIQERAGRPRGKPIPQPRAAVDREPAGAVGH
jgi:Helix-turn-helix domain